MWVLRYCTVPRAEVIFVTMQRKNIRPSKKEINKSVKVRMLPDVCSYAMNHHVSFRWPTGSLPSTCMLCTRPHCTKDVYTPQGLTRDVDSTLTCPIDTASLNDIAIKYLWCWTCTQFVGLCNSILFHSRYSRSWCCSLCVQPVASMDTEIMDTSCPQVKFWLWYSRNKPSDSSQLDQLSYHLSALSLSLPYSSKSCTISPGLRTEPNTTNVTIARINVQRYLLSEL
jgi:hypothetical protein